MKMLLLGLGKCEGAKVYHRAIQDFSFRADHRQRGRGGARPMPHPGRAGHGGERLRPDGADRGHAARGVCARERELLVLAKRLMPRLPFQRVDVLLIDRIGKDISGTGFDPNVVGRKFNDHKALEDEWPKVRRIALRGLSGATHGNAHGLGMAEFCRSQLLRRPILPPSGSTASARATSAPRWPLWTTRPTARCWPPRWARSG